jgi:hypothetical protein
MKKTLFVLMIAVIAILVVVMPATATPPDTSVSGRWCYGYLEEGEHKSLGQNVFYTLDSTDAWLGTFVGSSQSYGIVLIHPSGYTLLKDDVYLDPVTVDGKTGTLQMRVNGWLPAGADYDAYEGTWVINGGTGDLANLHGQGTWVNVEFLNSECTAIDTGLIASVTYSGSIHFDP